MNKIDFSFPGGFPFETNTLDFMQVAFASCINALGALGGDNYIISGCVTTGGNVSPGWMVINGELLPFQGGILQTNVLVRENKQSAKFQDLVDRDAYVTRFVTFGTGIGQIAFNSLGSIKTLLTVKAELASIQQSITSIIPAGIIVAWSGAILAIPAGWALCDGTNGRPDLTDTFIIGAGGDLSPGSVGGEKNVLLYTSNLPKHSHQFQMAENGAGSEITYPAVTDNHTLLKGVGTTQQAGGDVAHNNMPPYFALAYIIKL